MGTGRKDPCAFHPRPQPASLEPIRPDHYFSPRNSPPSSNCARALVSTRLYRVPLALRVSHPSIHPQNLFKTLSKSVLADGTIPVQGQGTQRPGVERVWPAHAAGRPKPAEALRAAGVGGPGRDLAGINAEGAAKGGVGFGLRDAHVSAVRRFLQPISKKKVWCGPPLFSDVSPRNLAFLPTTTNIFRCRWTPGMSEGEEVWGPVIGPPGKGGAEWGLPGSSSTAATTAAAAAANKAAATPEKETLSTREESRTVWDLRPGAGYRFKARARTIFGWSPVGPASAVYQTARRF